MKKNIITDRSLAKQQKQVILWVYLILTFAFVCMCSINLLAYFSFMNISAMYTTIQEHTSEISQHVRDINLFINKDKSLSQGDKDYIVELFRKTKRKVSKITTQPQKNNISKAIAEYEMNLTEYLQTNKEVDFKNTNKSYTYLMSSLSDTKYDIKLLIMEKEASFHLLYFILLINLLILCWFIIFIIRRFILNIRKKEKELDDSYNYLDTILNSVGSILISVDSNGSVIHFNKSFIEYFEKINSQNEFVSGQHFWITLPFLDKYRHLFHKSIKNFSIEHFNRIGPVATGNYYNLSIYPFNYSNDTCAVILLNDITDMMLQEENVSRLQKMDAVGKLASGIVHNFKNFMGAISGAADSINFSLTHEKSDCNAMRNIITKDVELIDDALKNTSDLTSQLLLLSQNQQLKFTLLELNEIVKKVLAVCKTNFPKSIKIEVSYSINKAYIYAYASQIEQVLLNLCINSSHAMTFMRDNLAQTENKITVSVGEIAHNSDYPELPKDGDYWIIEVSDTGVGISKDKLPKIFDPFFTTKEKDKGTGLGLSMVYNIVKSHNGIIEIDSEVGVGTTFKIILPKCDEEVIREFIS